MKQVDVSDTAPFANVMVVCSGRSEKHVGAVAGGLKMEMKRLGVCVGGEGVAVCGVGGWQVVDLGAVVVHVMTEAERDLYKLEELWGGRMDKVVDGGEGGGNALGGDG